ncbi:hypothetical protein [Halanaerobium hydrogeniformans]|uniref:Uncharacterized protein n=1 Tax=Halanaerobium hydrogeniformans TaxID=656519 RepID=E4RK68_HALHG|nr:hypothetical protein [Halanaerobium hydrogeniformans]ADQ14620.1 hypothetical protein Halsa_1189 [Halanaerobium hydrogeniformans]
MRNLRNKKLIILLSILALFALVLVGCGVDDIEEEPVEEPMQEEPMEEPAPPMEEEPAPAPEDDMNGEF